MSEPDREKNPLEDSPFEFRKFKNGNVSIFWHNKEVLMLKGVKAQKFLADIEAKNDFEKQLVMAKITGNFKRGNERTAKSKRK